MAKHGRFLGAAMAAGVVLRHEDATVVLEGRERRPRSASCTFERGSHGVLIFLLVLKEEGSFLKAYFGFLTLNSP